MPDEEVITPDDGGVEVEIVSSKGDKEQPRLSDEQIADHEKVSDDEIGKYAKEAQKRIRGLRIANQEWRRRTMQSSQDVATATSLAEQLYRENQELKASVNRSETALIDQAIARCESQLAQAKAKVDAARAAGDTGAETAAFEELARAVAERDRLNLVKQQPAPPVTAPSAQPAPQPQPRPVQQPPESPRLQAWRRDNPWFLQKGEEALSGYALGVHQELEAKGVTEASNPDLYYSTIDARLREKFPERFARPAARPAPVTGGTRVNGAPGEAEVTDPNKVRLTESEVRIARKLNISLEDYAKQKVAYANEQRERQAKVTIQ